MADGRAGAGVGAVSDLSTAVPPRVDVRPASALSGCALLTLGVGSGEVHAGSARLAETLGVDLPGLLARDPRAGEPGTVTVLPASGAPEVSSVMLAGTGAGTPADLRRAAAAATRRARQLIPRGPITLASDLARAADSGAGPLAAAEAHLLAAYRPGRPDCSEDLLVLLDSTEQIAATAQVTATAAITARALANTPSQVKSPQWLAERAVRLGQAAGLKTEVLGPDDLVQQGFGGLVGVGAGSPRGPHLVRLDYRPRGSRRHVVLVGKGITFDSGGLSLKRGAGMETMKTDMAGAAAVLGAMTALPALGGRDRVTALLALAENMPSGSAIRPGDVLQHYGGRTVEVLNTDAEGRLVLADALAYAVERLAPDALVDLATLTGNMRITLGSRIAGLFATDDALASALITAGEEVGEPLWRLPLVEDYLPSLDSPVADLANIGREVAGSAISGGAITAALFLRAFTGDVPWAHLDIAGTARASSDREEFSRGATGFGVRLLLRWLLGAG